MNRYDFILKKALNLINSHSTNNPKVILKELGVNLIPFKSKTKLLGMYTIIKRNYFVFYNPNIDANMLNMVFAHELGHHILHKKEATNNTLHEFELFDISSILETEANIFAAHLLINENDIKNLASQGFTYDQIAQDLGVNINLLLFKISEMRRIYQKEYRLNPINNKFFNKIDSNKKNYDIN